MSWCWGYLGRKIRVVIPSCVVLRIRQEFPDAGGSYVGFRPPLDWTVIHASRWPLPWRVCHTGQRVFQGHLVCVSPPCREEGLGLPFQKGMSSNWWHSLEKNNCTIDIMHVIYWFEIFIYFIVNNNKFVYSMLPVILMASWSIFLFWLWETLAFQSMF